MWEEQLQEVFRTNDQALFEDWLITYEAETGDVSLCNTNELIEFLFSNILTNLNKAYIGNASLSRTRSDKILYYSKARTLKRYDSNIMRSSAHASCRYSYSISRMDHGFYDYGSIAAGSRHRAIRQSCSRNSNY